MMSYDVIKNSIYAFYIVFLTEFLKNSAIAFPKLKKKMLISIFFTIVLSLILYVVHRYIIKPKHEINRYLKAADQ